MEFKIKKMTSFSFLPYAFCKTNSHLSPARTLKGAHHIVLTVQVSSIKTLLLTSYIFVLLIYHLLL